MRDILGFILLLVVITVLTSPESVGRWMAKIEAGRGSVLCAPQSSTPVVEP